MHIIWYKSLYRNYCKHWNIAFLCRLLHDIAFRIIKLFVNPYPPVLICSCKVLVLTYYTKSLFTMYVGRSHAQGFDAVVTWLFCLVSYPDSQKLVLPDHISTIIYIYIPPFRINANMKLRQSPTLRTVKVEDSHNWLLKAKKCISLDSGFVDLENTGLCGCHVYLGPSLHMVYQLPYSMLVLQRSTHLPTFALHKFSPESIHPL